MRGHGGATALVLAAGTASRFGSTKQLALVGDRPLVRHVVEVALAAGVGDVLVVTGHDADAVEAELGDDPRVRTVRNPRPEDGMASSLRVGVEALRRGRSVVVLLADQPGIAPEHVRAVLDAVRDRPAARVRYRDHAGHPVAFRADQVGALAGLRGDVGARGLLRELGPHEVEVDTDAPPDVDTPADLLDLEPPPTTGSGR